MRNLTPLLRKISYWDAIVNAKPHASRTPLQAIRPQVFQRFRAYSAHIAAQNIETIVASPFIAPNIALLEGCYSSSNGLSNLKSKIKGNQPDLLKGECQYCNIGEPDTFDHYLPQNLFPEFSAFSINLIPCCSTCNNGKGQTWLILGQRKTINLYYDAMPNVVFLSCTIQYRQNVPQANFSINLAAVAAPFRDIVNNHYSALNLLERYKHRSNTEIDDVRNVITPFAGRFTRAQIRAQLQQEAANMQISKGLNYWRAICKLALASSNRFLTDCGF